MNNSTIQSIIDLVTGELFRHWTGTEEDKSYVYAIADGYDRNLVKRAVRFVTNGENGRDGFDFSSTGRFNWNAQGMISVISWFLETNAETMDLDSEMTVRARQLRGTVHESHIPASLRSILLAR